jgi:tetratricopeptide (TPR) repeat protein
MTLTWLHEHVRYTGIEFSDAAIVPWPPAETLKRGFGDCKDKATLLVALLRHAGIRADLALLETGPGLDIDRALPGMGAFDHAIVRAKLDGKDVWIDATEDLLPAGQLPARDQNRSALVIAVDTKDVVVTPASSAADNVIREVRTYRIPEDGKAALREVSTQTGTFFDSQRAWIRDSSHADLDKALGRYVEDQYHGKLVSFTHDAPGDLAKPFAVTVEAADVARVITHETGIDAYLFASAVLQHVPAVIGRAGKSEDADADARRFDFEWAQPHVFEIENRLVVPTGFTMPAVVARDSQALGTSTLTTTRHIDGDTLVVTFRFDTGKRRVTPAELRATRKAIVELRKQNAEHIQIARTSELLIQQTKIKDAIAEAERLIALHPKEALHHAHLAEIYRRVGMGAAARREAAKAVALEPKSSLGYGYLGWELRHDTLGRFHGWDADRKGAADAFRKALAIDGTHHGALVGLAEILSTDDHWDPSANKRDVTEAVALWKRAKDVDSGDDYDGWIVDALARIGELADAERIARAMPESEKRSTLLVSVIAQARGAGDAIATAKSLASGDVYGRVLAAAGSRLLLARRYDLVHAFAGEIPNMDPKFVAIWKGVQKVDVAKLDPADPKTPVLYLVSAVAGEPVANPPWDSLVADSLKSSPVKIPGVVAVRQQFRGALRDVLAAALTMRVEGSAGEGYRVTAELGGLRFITYVAMERGKAKMVGSTEFMPAVGQYALGLLAKNDVATASQWIRRVVDDTASSRDANSPAGKLYKDEIARVGNGAMSKEIVELLAAWLAAGADAQAKATVPIFTRCVPAAPEAKALCATMLVHVYDVLGRWREMVDVARKAYDDAPTQDKRVALAVALLRVGQPKESAEVFDRALAKAPDDVEILRARVELADPTTAWADLRPVADKLAAHARATASDLNSIAWAQLYLDGPAGAAVASTRIVQMRPKPNYAQANTLAAVAAEADRVAEAWDYMKKAFDDNVDAPRDADWYVIGRIAEACGLRDDAIAAYKRIPPRKKPGGAITASDFAQRNLKRLGVR